MGVREGARQQCFFSGNPHRFRGKGRQKGNGQTRQESGLAGVHFREMQCSFPGIDSFYNEL